MHPIVIAGLGVSGLGCAVELSRRGIPFTAFEKESRPGGLARTDETDGFRFDVGPHVLLGAPDALRELFRDLPDLDLKACSGGSGIVMDSHLSRVIPTPFQSHLNWLPLHVRAGLLFDALYGRTCKSPTNYPEYAIARAGPGVYDLFLRGYETKRLRFDLNEIPADWTNRVDQTRWRALLRPRMLDRRSHESSFLYPQCGEIEALPRAMSHMLPEGCARYGCRLTAIDAEAKVAWFGDGTMGEFEYLVASVPLPEIVFLIKDAPAGVVRAAESLIYTSIYIISIGVEGEPPPWTLLRFPDQEFAFYRLSFPASYAVRSAPDGHYSVVGEISHHSMRHAITVNEAREALLSGLERLGIVKRGQRVVAESVRDIRYGHIVYDHATRANMRVIHEYLRSHCILPCGKYGLWKDMLIPESIRSGMAVAEEIAADYRVGMCASISR